MPSPSRTANKPAATFWLMLAFLALVALTGGASRLDVRSLVILKPAAVLVCALALIPLRRTDVAPYRWLFIGIGAAFALSFIQLVPLPPILWQNLPGRAELAAVDTAAGLGPIWRPLTVTPNNGWHAITALFVPLATLLLGVRLSRRDLYRFLPVLIAFGSLSGLLGLLQVVSRDTSLNWYEVTNVGSAVGLFANRNHAALMLAILFPMLAVWSTSGEEGRERRWLRLWAAGALGVVLFPLILITGSRAGLLLCLIGVASALAIAEPALRRRSSTRSSRRLASFALVGLGAIAILAAIAASLTKANAIMRLANTSFGNDDRIGIWKVALNILWKYFPFGSGVGSFQDVYQIVEPGYQLNTYYMNHAHQDIIEIGITLGLPGLLLLGCAAFGLFRRTAALWTRRDGEIYPVRIARMAWVVLVMMALASLADYPLRTPVMMCIAVILTLWLVEPERERPSSASARPGPGSRRK